MMKRLFSILFALGLLQGDGVHAAGESPFDDDAKPRVRWLAAAPGVAAGQSIGGDLLGLAEVRGALVDAAVVTHLAPGVRGIALRQTRSSTSPGALDLLVGAALDRCREAGALKVLVATHADPRQIRDVAQRHGFQFAGQRQSSFGTALGFYTDLYFTPATPDGGKTA